MSKVFHWVVLDDQASRANQRQTQSEIILNSRKTNVGPFACFSRYFSNCFLPSRGFMLRKNPPVEPTRVGVDQFLVKFLTKIQTSKMTAEFFFHSDSVDCVQQSFFVSLWVLIIFCSFLPPSTPFKKSHFAYSPSFKASYYAFSIPNPSKTFILFPPNPSKSLVMISLYPILQNDLLWFPPPNP